MRLALFALLLETAWVLLAAAALYFALAQRVNRRTALLVCGCAVVAYAAGALLHPALAPPRAGVTSSASAPGVPDNRIWQARLSELTVPGAVDAVAPLTGTIDVRNTSPVPWPANGPVSIRLGYFWIAADGTQISQGRVAFPHDVAPGEALRVPFTVAAPSKPGRYLLRFDVVYETIRWFEKPLTAPVTVRS